MSEETVPGLIKEREKDKVAGLLLPSSKFMDVRDKALHRSSRGKSRGN